MTMNSGKKYLQNRTGSINSVLYFAFFFLLVLGVAAVQPYQPAPAPSALGEMWRWHHMAELDRAGFRCMASAPDGSIWFGVNNGLLRYDGTQWEAHDKESGFVNNAVKDVAVTTDGTVYAVSNNALYRYKNEQWERVFPVVIPSPVALTCVLPSTAGGVWVGSSRGFLHVKDQSVTLWTEHFHMGGVIKLLPEGAKVEIIPDFRSRNWGLMVGLHEAADGVLSIGYTSGWFLQMTPKRTASETNQYQSVKLNTSISRDQSISMFELEDGALWAGVGAHVYEIHMDDESYTPWPLSEQHEDDRVRYSLLKPAGCAPVIASSSQLFSRTDGSWALFSYPGQDSSSFPQLMMDGNQNLWVGKHHGKVYRVDLSDDRWKTYEGLIFQGEDSSGAQWFLSAEGRVICHRGAEWLQYDEKDGLPDVPVALVCARNGAIWVIGSHQHQAASSFLDQEGRWNRTIHAALPYWLSPMSLFEDEEGRIWFGAYSGTSEQERGLICAKPDGAGGVRFIHHKTPKKAWCITEVPEGELVVGVRDLWSFNGTQFTFIQNELKGIGKKYVDLDCTADGSVWIANVGAGVHRFKDGRWTSYGYRDGLTDNMVSSLLARNTDDVWALSANGLSYFDGKGWISTIYGSLFPGTFLLNSSMHEAKDGSLWLNYVTPDWFQRSNPRYNMKSNITFRSIRCRPASRPPETQIIDSMEWVALPGSTTIRWKGTSPWQETEDATLYYSWRLDDEAWSAYSLNRDVTLRSMKPGRHTFEVRARDYDLNVDPTPAAISFVAVAPVWQQAWFILLIVLFIGVILLAIWLWFRIHEVKAVAEEKYATDLERMKLRFFTNISHELRTPLTVLLGTLKSIMADPKHAVNEPISMALRNARKLHTLVNEMLDLRKIEQGDWKLEPKYGDIVLFVRDIVESLQPMAVERGISIWIESCESSAVWFDPGKLHKIVNNLISNAIKYGSANGSVKVYLDIEATNAEAKSVTLRVDDDGVGIAAEDLPNVFERFYQGSGYSPAKSSSSGIGLSFTKELVELWGGSVEVESPVKGGRGTRFTVRLPLNIQSRDAAESEVWQQSDEADVGSNVPEATAAGLEKEKILIIDDDADLRQFIGNELNARYEIFEAVDGEDGARQAVEIIPDLILCDVMMPKVGGLELCAQLKQDELTQAIPVIMLSGRSGEDSELNGLQAGVDDYITKPFEISQLKARIRNLLKSRRQLRERYSKEIAEVSRAASKPKVEDAFLQRAIEIVEDHLSDYEFDATVLAEKMVVSSSSLWRKLKLAAEKTPAAFIRELRLKQAYLKLQEENLLIEEIAEKVGFLDTNYFRRCFKKQFGMTPGQCREKAETKEMQSEAMVENTSLSVLVVEDDADLRLYLCNELRARGYSPLEAENGREGLELALSSLANIIVSDLMMPIMNGLELCAEIKKNESTNHIPFVLLTARTDPKIKLEGLNCGADEYLNKPFEMEVLSARLNNLLENRRQMAARYRRKLEEPSAEPSAETIEDPFLQRVMACIEEHLKYPDFSVEQLAEMVGVTSRTLQRKIPTLVDLSPKVLIKTVRLKKAYQLLMETDRLIAEIAQECGFEHSNYFSVQFKQQYGTSPSHIRKDERS